MLFDLIGALASLLSTYYFIRLDIKAWPVGLIASCFNGWLYWQKGIYADMFLESFYLLSLCYGWYRWSTPQHQKLSSLQRLSHKQWMYLGAFLVAVYVVIFYLLSALSHSTVPKLDALTTSLSLAAQCLMCYKVIATWVLWFIADALYALIYLHKDLPIHTFLMLVYTVMAFMGYLHCIKNVPKCPIIPQPLNLQSTEPMA